MKSKIKLGLVIVLPFCFVIYLVKIILKIAAEFSHEIFWQFISPSLPWLIEGISTLIFIFLLAWSIGFLYYSQNRKTIWLKNLIDKCLSNTPFLKNFWHTKSNESFDLSKTKGAFIRIFSFVWVLVFIVARQETKEGSLITTTILPTFPLPFTGNLFFIFNEKELQATKRIRYLKNSPAELSQTFLSFGLNSKKFEFEN